MKTKMGLFLLSIVLSFFLSCNVGAKEIQINKKNFPDIALRQIVKKEIDKNKNGKLSQKEIKGVKTLVIDKTALAKKYDLGTEITDETLQAQSRKKMEECKTVNCKGIQIFRNLTYLDIEANSYDESYYGEGCIKYLEKVKQLKKLKTLILKNGGNVKTLNVSKMKNLRTLKIYLFPKLKKLNLSKNEKLKVFHLNAGISEINLKKNVRLREIRLLACKKISGLNIKQNTELTLLDISGTTGIKTLDLRKNQKIKTLWAKMTRLQDITLHSQNCVEEAELGISNILNSAIEQMNTKTLRRLGIYGTPITTLDISKFFVLEKLKVSKDVAVQKNEQQDMVIETYSTRTSVEEDEPWLLDNKETDLTKAIIY